MPTPEEMRRHREDQEAHTARLNEALKRIAEHPVTQMRAHSETVRQDLASVVMPNFEELAALLARAAEDPMFAMELVQNVGPPIEADKFHANVNQRLHNYVASVFTLIEHTQTIMNLRKKQLGSKVDWLREPWNDKKAELRLHPEFPFIVDLRTYIQHYSLTYQGATVSWSSVNTPTQEIVSGVFVQVVPLREWERTSEATKLFLKDHDTVPLLPVIVEHARLFYEANSWLHNQLVAECSPFLDEYNELKAQYNAVLDGLSIEDARTATAQRTRDLEY
jgi:hypothetical protein